MRLASWNVNGLRACASRGFADWLANCGAQVVGLQEVRATAAQLPAELCVPSGWQVRWHAAQRPGYSGVGLFSRVEPDEYFDQLGIAEFDDEGRFQAARFGSLLVVNSYFPNGKGKERDNSRVPFKLRYYRALAAMLQQRRQQGQRIVVMGDFNTAHREIDLACPRQNIAVSGFLPQERAEIDAWLAAGWVDAYRYFDASPERYTWWSARSGARQRNVGWRIDFILVTDDLLLHLESAAIHTDILGSDHCPVSLDLAAEAFEKV